MTTTNTHAAPAASAPAPGGPSAWAPLRHKWFRALWLAQFASSVGGWMQTVAAQWLMLTLTRAPLPVALVQTALSLPVFLFGLPAGALGDVLDRRRLLVASQAFTLVAAAVLAALAFVGLMSPLLLLTFTFLIGTGGALMAPAWIAIQPGLVAREEIPQATAINAVSINLSRAVGPAIGGVIVAAAGAAAAFAVNALSFVGALVTLQRWPHRPDPRPLGAEPIMSAMRTGLAYVRHSPPVQVVLARAALFLVFSSGMWALLPIVASRHLGLGSAGYGMLLSMIGLGAVVGALILNRARERFGLEATVNTCIVVFGLGMVELALAPGLLPPDLVDLVLMGIAWIGSLSSLSAAAQTSLPSWVRARAMAVYLLVFQGTQALGSVVWGAFAERYGATLALGIAGAGVIVGPLATITRPLTMGTYYERELASLSPEPRLGPSYTHDTGPVLVIREYKVPPENAREFENAMRLVRGSRRRFGAQRWNLYHDAEDPTMYVETFTANSWQEHLRQHAERTTAADRMMERQALKFARGEPRTTHLISAE
ncbi:MFS transporter [Planosporangium sp. 12N6]|uniref:MFS transporter n=1 Tax=Planosporangium spinosum TaxID=3402278 RepID=UPI003CEDA591